MADSLYNELRRGYPDRAFDSRYARLFLSRRYDPQLPVRQFSTDETNEQWREDLTLMDESRYYSFIHSPWTTEKAISEKEKNSTNASETKKINVDVKPTINPSSPALEEISARPMDLVITRPNFWKFAGDYYLQFMQNTYSSNWYQGGESNYSVLGRVTLQANYNNKQKVKFENRLEMNLGFQTNKSDTVHSVKTSSDQLRYTGKFGLQASKKWYYTLQAVGTTQFTRSYASNSRSYNSAFLAPLTLNISLGMDYEANWLKGKLKGSAHIAPIATNYKYVSKRALVTRHGIKEGDKHITDYGSTITLDGTWKFSDNISWKTRLYWYTTYKRTEITWENTINLKVSKYISANIYIYPRFDDSTSRKHHKLGYLQMKEYTSLGFSYSM